MIGLNPALYQTRLSSNATASGPTAFAWYSNYVKSPSHTDVDLATAYANNQFWRLLSGDATIALTASTITATPPTAQMTYAAGTPAGPPHVYAFPIEMSMASTYWSMTLTDHTIVNQAVATVAKTYAQISYSDPATNYGYGVSYQMEADGGGGVSAYGLIVYRQDVGGLTIIATPAITPVIATTATPLDIHFDVDNSTANPVINLRAGQYGVWTDVSSWTDTGSPIAGTSLIPVLVHGLTGDSDTTNGNTVITYGAGTNGISVSNQVGVVP